MNDPIAQFLPSVVQFHTLGPQLALILGIMMFFGTWGGFIFQKLHIPQVVGYFVVGILIGDSGFQLITPDAVAALNPISIIALAFIGFLVGGELKGDVIKKDGKQFVSVLLFESLTPAIIVSVFVTLASYLFTKDFIKSLCFGMLLGAICSSTAPEATTNVMQEYHSKGPLTTMVYGIVAMDDAVALILFAVASTIAAPLLGGHAVSLGTQLLNIAYNVFGSIILGLILGFLLTLIIKKLMNKEGLVLSFTLGILLFSTGVCDKIGLSNILTAMSIGFYMANFAPKQVRAIFPMTNRFTPPVYVLFFVVVGAKLNIWAMRPMLLVLAAVYIIGRTLGKSVGSWFGALITKAPRGIQKYMQYCLLSQAGVAIGLSLTAGNYFKDTIGDSILLVVTATTFIVELIGPVFVKYGITKAGEVGLDVTEEDIKKNTCVQEVTWGNEHICSLNSPAIVNENDTIRIIVDSFSRQQNLNYAVRSMEGKLIGVISLEHMKDVMQLGDFAESMLAMDIMDKPLVTCSPSLPLPEAYRLFDENDLDAVPIVGKDNEPMGMLERFTVDHYLHARILELHRKIESLTESA